MSSECSETKEKESALMHMDNAIVGVCESAETKELVAALAKAQAEYKPVRKSATNNFAGFRYPTFGDMAAATYPALNKHGLVMQFQEGVRGGREVLVGRLRHSTGQWIASTCPIHYPVKKGGEVQEDGQGLEIGTAYARKTLLMELTGAWLEGDEPEVAGDHATKASAEIVEKVAAKAAAPVDEFKKIENRMKVVRTIPQELAAAFAEAERLTLAGSLSEEQLVSLQKKFGALLPKKEVANA
jgi:hypothetical protein